MSITENERKQLHDLLDGLLNTRQDLECIDVKSLKGGKNFFSTWSKPRSEFVEESSRFLRQVIGPYLHYHELSLLNESELVENDTEPDHLATVANAVRSFMPLFEAEKFGPTGMEFMSSMMTDFIGIHWGDEPRFFAVLPKNKGQHKRPFRIAYQRLGALNWELILKEAGVATVERQNTISSAYRTFWEAIRKWKYSIYESFDLVPGVWEHNEHEVEAFKVDSDKTLQRIQSDGDAYWVEKSNI
jgi:hypothetical protein